MWSETDLDSEHFVSENLLTNSRPKENGDYHHSHSLDPVDPLMGPGPGGHSHLLRHEMLSDAMLGHVAPGAARLDTRDRDQVEWAPSLRYLAKIVSQRDFLRLRLPKYEEIKLHQIE